ncbi:ABC transporter ATP-binding protein [Flagellimonas marinaquae]|uniref:ABC transporter ATP-binding protein n=1 Tax=Flagellimonas aurea TaxID=2915619 RepID=A0ABS3G116_9FLAO|nr:ABC transporter ATP-binding protein [Allomuricauda aurea]MAO18482.1 ABC transporter ATP-binding protein [Allomuricauda sp.]MBO0352749.1 ABC transporter ATP-binding protein [Allomuricauda aurea]UBZ15756.1 ABC transporter ATP-binding protein [Allomuricauda aquimarina]
MLEAIDLTKKYGGFTALDSLNLTVDEGDIFCLLGANGAGKSTTINLFLNFIEPTSGRALINGLDVTEHARKTKQWLSYIPENLQLYKNLTGLENLEFFCGLGGVGQDRDALESLLLKSGLQKDFVHQRVDRYSKGMRQKVGIALARAKGAKVLLLDEPTSGLDPKASNEFSELLLEMKDQKVATLMATHDLFRAKDTGTHIGIMKEGTLLETMETSEISFNDLESKYLRHMHA